MTRKMLALAVVALVLFAWSGLCQAGPVLERIVKSGELRVGMDPTFPPLESKDENGKLVGMDVDLAGSIARGMGVRLVLVELPFKDLIPALLNHKIDLILSGMTITPERNLQVVFVGPYILSGQTVLIKNTLADRIYGAKDLDNAKYKVTAAEHTTAAEAVRHLIPKAKLVTAANESESLKLLLAEKVNAMVADLTFGLVAAFKHRKDGILHLARPFTYEPSGMAIAPGDPELANWLQNHLTQLEGTGKLEAMKNKWFKEATWME